MPSMRSLRSLKPQDKRSVSWGWYPVQPGATPRNRCAHPGAFCNLIDVSADAVYCNHAYLEPLGECRLASRCRSNIFWRLLMRLLAKCVAGGFIMAVLGLVLVGVNPL